LKRVFVQVLNTDLWIEHAVMGFRFSKVKWPLFAVMGAGFLWIKQFGLHHVAGGDENAYFYMARLMTEGKFFYSDFFFAHPPLQLFLLSTVYASFGFNFVLLKLTAALPILIGAGFLYHQLWSKKNELAAGFFLIIFLFNYELLKITSHPFGLNLTTFFLMLSLYYFVAKRPLACGLWWGTACLSGLYGLPWGLIPAGYYLFWDRGRRSWIKYAGGFALVFISLNLILIALFGEKYVTPVYLYHFLKPHGNELVIDLFLQVVKSNFPLFFLPFLYIWAPKTRLNTAVLAGGIMYLIFLGSLDPLFSQYFMLPLPFFAWVGAVSAASWIENIHTTRVRLSGVILSLIILGAFSIDNMQRYIIHERGTTFQNAEACRDFITRNSSPDALLFGHAATTPLLALLCDRDIALNMVDTNHMRFEAGIDSIGDTLRKLEQETRLKFFIIQESRFWMGPEIQRFLKDCRPGAVFEEPRARIVIFDCGKK